MTKVYHRSQRDDWATPPEVFDPLMEEFNFTLDAAASVENTKCRKFFTEEDNGLVQSWRHQRVWCNPPYSLAKEFIAKAYHEVIELGHCPVAVFLLAARTDTRAWFDYIHGKAEIRFIRGRIKFVGAEHPAPFPSAIIIWRRQ